MNKPILLLLLLVSAQATSAEYDLMLSKQLTLKYPTVVTDRPATTDQLSLLETYKRALANDPELASALSANQAAQEVIEQSKALYRPTLNFTASASNSHTDIRYLDGDIPSGRSSFDTYRAGLEARQPIYRKENLLQMDQAKTQVSQADKQYHLSQQALILKTTEAYFDVLIAQDKIDLIAAQKTAILSQLDQARATFEVGTSTITDVNEAQARYDLTAAQEIAAINEHKITLRAVEAIIGEMPSALTTVQSEVQVSPLEQTMEEWLEIARANNLNIQIQRDVLKLAEQDVELAKAGHHPTLDAFASYTNNYTNGSPSVFSTGNQLKNATIGVQLEVPLYQGGAVNSRVRQAVHNKQKAQDDLDAARRKIDLDTQRSYLNLNTSIAQVRALEQALVSSQSQLDSTKLGYEVGVRTSVDVLDAQQQFYSAKSDLLQARYNYLVNIIRLKAVAGLVAEADLVEINELLLAANAPKQ